MSNLSSKQLYLIRHGESTHNVFAEQNHSEEDPFFWDAVLSDKGMQQVEALKKKVAALAVDLVVCSPLTRAIQTCLGAFGDRSLPLLLVEISREKIENACDIGKPLSQLRLEFPQFDFSFMFNEIWWFVPERLQGKVTVENFKEIFEKDHYREPEELLSQRVKDLKQWLLKRPEKRIAIVGHSNFLREFLGVREKMPNCHVEPYTLTPPS
jgi:broad specificity phosphatase PhoE